jgi:predicted GIY-YIG superfamily endonuclease
MAWIGNNLPWHLFTILLHVPTASGVYALRRDDVWIYLGETEDLQRRLLEHHNGSDRCIAEQRPTSFGFELSAPATRAARWRELILEFRPVCNRG